MAIELDHQNHADTTGFVSDSGADPFQAVVDSITPVTADSAATPASILQLQALQTTAQPLALADATATAATAAKIVVNAAGSAAGGVSPHFKVLVDGAVVGEGTAGGDAKDFSFDASVTADQAHKIQIQYDNDGAVDGQDRNLTVNAVTINGHKVAPTDAAAAYDKGALDGKDVVPGQANLWWNGTLAVSAPKEFFTATSAAAPAAPSAPASGTSDYPSAPASQIYYVDATNGNDGNSGHDPSQAWKSLDKVNSTTFAAGSQILFERGETWHDSLLASTSGTSDKPVIYGAYGTGANPVIEAASGSSYTVSLNNKDNITFDSLTMKGSGDTGLLLNGGADNVKVTNSQILDSQGSGIVISGTSHGLRIDHSTIDGNGGYGIVHYSADNADQYITNSVISDNGWKTDAVYSGWNGRILSGEIAGNTIFNNGSGGGDGRSHGLYHDHSQANSTLKIHGNTIYDNPRGAGILAKSSTEIYDNTIYGNANVGISVGQNQGTSVTYKIYGNEIFNNNGGIMEHLKGAGSITLDVHDNVFNNNNGRSAISIADSVTQNVVNNTISSANKANPTA
ncbi:right-handed parallel beta-helix repeat-containing protein [Azospirillum isscasi]